MLAWDRAKRGKHGGKRKGAGRPPKAPKEFKPEPATVDYGTSAQAASAVSTRLMIAVPYASTKP
jgi:hypothetical protein